MPRKTCPTRPPKRKPQPRKPRRGARQRPAQKPRGGKLVDGLREGEGHGDPSKQDSLVRALRREIDTLKKRADLHLAGEDVIRAAVFEALDEPLEITLPPPRPPGRGKDLETPVLHLCDLHFGKRTPTYDSAVASERLALAAAKTLDMTQRRRVPGTRIDCLRLYLGGDIIEGENIFPTQAHLIDQSVFDQAVRTAPAALAEAILHLLTGFRSIHVVAVPGNHGRNGPRKGNAHPRTDWDAVCYRTCRHIVDKALAGELRRNRRRVTWDLPDDRPEAWWALDRLPGGWGNLIVHGHEIRGGFAGFPWYGAGRKTMGWVDVIGQPFDYLFSGHFHTAMSLDHNRHTILGNGSSESTNTHARQELASEGTPKQRLAFFDRRLGMIVDMPLYLDPANRHPNRMYSHASY